MSAETLRRAAETMLQRAIDARAGRWVSLDDEVRAVWQDSREVATCHGSLPEGNAANAAHIASWHPAVALAVADLIENEASLIDSAERYPDLHFPLNGARVDRLLAVARAYLGSEV